MNKMRGLSKYLGILAGSLVLGTVLLWSVYLLPTDPMKANVERSTDIYDYEGVYPQLMWGYKMSQLDNCTDAIMLLNAIYSGEESALRRAMEVYRTEYVDENPVKSLTNLANNVQAEKIQLAYPRYWHGYLIFLKPLLLFWDVADIRIFNMFLQMGMFFYAFYLMIENKYQAFLPAFVISILLLNPIAIVESFQFSTVYDIMMISVIYILKRNLKGKKTESVFFLISGICVAYFDFFTYPLAALFFPLIFVILDLDDWKEAVKKIFAACLAWGVGYIGMWGGKWVVSSILLQKNFLADAFSRINLYNSMDYGKCDANVMQVIWRDLQVLVKWPILLLAVLIVGYYGTVLFRSRAKIRRSRIFMGIPYGLIALAPLVWHIATKLHVYYHYWFTYREIGISVLAALVWIVGLDKAEHKESIEG